jgi:Calcineurin-like phosphoesterase
MTRATTTTRTVLVIVIVAAGMLPLLAFTPMTSVEQQQGDGQDGLVVEGDLLNKETDVNGSNFNIAAVGDWGCTSNTEDTVRNIVDKDPELVIALGDNAYWTDSADCWFEIVNPIIDKMITAIGNHDANIKMPGEAPVEAPKLLGEYMDRFGLSEQYYTHRIGNVFVLVMSEEVPYREGSDQYDFVVQSLSEASSDPDVDWIIVATHETMYSSPSSTDAVDPLRETYHPIFEENGVDLVLQGHIHNYERSYPIEYSEEYSDQNPNVPIATSTDPDTYVDPEGQIFATVGTGGQSVHPFRGQRLFMLNQFEGYGFLDITITDDGREKRLVGTFYDNDGGSIVDQFTLIKEENRGVNEQVQQEDGVDIGPLVRRPIDGS